MILCAPGTFPPLLLFSPPHVLFFSSHSLLCPNTFCVNDVGCTHTLAAVTFDPAESTSWIISSLFVFVIDSVIYHSVGIFAKASAEFLLLVALGTLILSESLRIIHIHILCPNYHFHVCACVVLS